LERQSWFFSKISRDEAESILRQCAIGTFLVRYSSVQGCFAVSIYGPPTTLQTEPEIAHTLIVPCITTPGQTQYQMENHPELGSFDDVSKLVEATLMINYQPPPSLFHPLTQTATGVLNSFSLFFSLSSLVFLFLTFFWLQAQSKIGRPISKVPSILSNFPTTLIEELSFKVPQQGKIRSRLFRLSLSLFLSNAAVFFLSFFFHSFLP
jgi:hypothetical protein